MRRFLFNLVIIIAVVFASVICLKYLSPRIEQNNAKLHPLVLRPPTGSDVLLDVEWAMTEDQKRYGLMHRQKLENGMLFFFEKSEPLSFWMKNTFVPLDIVFFDDRGWYVSSASMQPCSVDPCMLYSSGKPARFALEMPAGFLLKTPIGKDWQVVP
jgi:uncharacterized membrane protein (UPF0127 family)